MVPRLLGNELFRAAKQDGAGDQAPVVKFVEAIGGLLPLFPDVYREYIPEPAAKRLETDRTAGLRRPAPGARSLPQPGTSPATCPHQQASLSDRRHTTFIASIRSLKTQDQPPFQPRNTPSMMGLTFDWKREVKACAARRIVGGPQAPAMFFNYGAADREAYADRITLRGKERFEDLVHLQRRQSRPGIAHRHLDVVIFCSLRDYG